MKLNILLFALAFVLPMAGIWTSGYVYCTYGSEWQVTCLFSFVITAIAGGLCGLVGFQRIGIKL